MVDKVTKKLTLNLSKVPTNKRPEVKKEIGDLIINEILKSVEQGKSPVSGESKFKKLNKKYAKDQKHGNTTPNLELEGDLLDSLTFKNTKQGIEVGIFKSSEVPKADGHNNFSGKSRLPKRRFIPGESQTFKRGIKSEINQIIQENEREPTRRAPTEPVFGTFTDVSTATTTAVETTDLFDDFLEDFFNGQN